MSISNAAIVYPDVIVGAHVQIEPFAVVGIPSRASRAHDEISHEHTGKVSVNGATRIGNHSHVGTHVVIEAGADLGDFSVIEHGALIERDTVIGEATFVVHGGRILLEARVGARCVVGGLIADRSVIGDECRVFGDLLHRQDHLGVGWDAAVEAGPVLGVGVFVARGAKVIGPVEVGDGVYICANGIVTRSVKPYHIAYGYNNSVPYEEWRGRLRLFSHQ